MARNRASRWWRWVTFSALSGQGDSGSAERFQGRDTDGFGWEDGHDCESGGVFVLDLVDLGKFFARAESAKGCGGCCCGEGVVDHPCPGVDLCALEIDLQLGCLQDRCGLGEGDEDDLGLLG